MKIIADVDYVILELNDQEYKEYKSLSEENKMKIKYLGLKMMEILQLIIMK